MSSTSTFSYIGFLCNEEINATHSDDATISIPDHLRSMFNKCWNEGRFIGEEYTFADESFLPISFKVLKYKPAQRIEQVVLKSRTSATTWQDTTRSKGD